MLKAHFQDFLLMRANADFERFLARLSPRLKAIAFKLNRGFYSMDNQDLFQEAVIFLWKNFRRDGFSGKTDSYILQGCYFHLQNFIRLSKDRISRVSIDAETSGNPAERADIADTRYLEFFTALDARLLADIICNNGLADREKKLLPLFAEGLTTREIGSRVGISHVRVVKIKKEIGNKCRKYLDRHIA